MILSVKEHEMHHRAQLMLIRAHFGHHTLTPHAAQDARTPLNAQAAKK